MAFSFSVFLFTPYSSEDTYCSTHLNSSASYLYNFSHRLSQILQVILALTVLFKSLFYPSLQFPSCFVLVLNQPHSQLYNSHVCFLLFPCTFSCCLSRSPSPDTMWKPLYLEGNKEPDKGQINGCDPFPECKGSQKTMPISMQHSLANIKRKCSEQKTFPHCSWLCLEQKEGNNKQYLIARDSL